MKPRHPRRHRTRLARQLALALAASPLAAAAADAGDSDTAVALQPVVVTGSRIEASSFDVPFAIDVVDLHDVQQGNLAVNVSEALARVPGVVVQNRQNYAQDLQISVRGFGARSAFGVRGVKLITDGIPATNPDGQGQAATFNLDTAERIEVLRGPFSTVYGNHAGGVIQLFSRDGAGPPRVRANALAGAWGTTKLGIGTEGEARGIGFVLDASRFDTDGYRDHSEARRDQAFAKLTLAPAADSKLTLVASGLHQPDTQDPLGLTWATYRRDPRAVETAATQFNTRKRIDHVQGGATWEQRFGSDRLQIVAYAGRRGITQFLAIPVAPQASPRHAGGVVDFDRDFHGLGARWIAERTIGDAHLTVTVGLDYDRSRDDRQGYENFVGATLGVKGRLRRDEINTITSTDPYVQAVWKQGDWQWSAGLRHSQVRFDVDDRFVAAGNPDDSGSRRFRETTPALGVVYALDPAVNLYASLAAGFETPTLNELSYASPTTGFNFDLAPSTSLQAELGLKAFVGDATRIDVALFEIRTRDEIVVAESLGGRTSFRNATRTLRRGLEAAIESALTDSVTARGTLTLLRARYDRAFDTGAGTVERGKRIPGIPATTAYAELAWQPLRAVTLAGEAIYRGKVYVEDRNRARPAPAYTLVNLRLSAEQRRGPWTFGQLVRVDNVFDREHIASVIVGQGQERFYEPGPERSWYAGVRASYRF
ncbi:MAG TPA: TonB-dependent receptor [Rhodocyclaceae bacterium]|nr:TonB-dependent receptor [Rhodocyclaceae bacterium]